MRKTILITGASSGLGEGMARAFAARGRNLALSARRVEQLERLRQELLAQYPDIRISVRQLDVNQHGQVFEVFEAFATEFGGLDRVIVNAGIGKGQRIGTGGFADNLATIQTNFVAALAQCEAAIGIFRRQNSGHLVAMSSVAALRGFAGSMTAYSASKAGLATLSEGIRADLLNTPIKVTTIYPGYIRTALNAGAKRLPFAVDAATGVRALIKAIEREPSQAYVPGWPWTAVGFLLRRLPLRMIRG
jgi:short-subunit dehydrogenase